MSRHRDSPPPCGPPPRRSRAVQGRLCARLSATALTGALTAVALAAPASASPARPAHAAKNKPASSASPRPSRSHRPRGLITGTGGVRFGLQPTPAASGRTRQYFMMSVGAGRSGADTVIITNAGRRREKLRIARTTGVTAANGGSAFTTGTAHRCAGAACWVRGLPKAVTLPAGASKDLSFTVHVPAHTGHGQYLAGITAQAAALPKSVIVGSNGKASARAIIIHQVTVAVAVTVGPLSSLRYQLRLPAVTGSAVGPTARLNLRVRNTGQMFTHAAGAAACTASGKRHSYRVYVATVLPGGSAVIPVNAPGLPQGASVPCTIRLHYGRHQTLAWAGTVTLPAPPKTRIIHTGNGTYSVLPVGGVPPWAMALLAVGGLLLLALIVLAVLLLRRRGRAAGGRPLPAGGPKPGGSPLLAGGRPGGKPLPGGRRAPAHGKHRSARTSLNTLLKDTPRDR
jgi:Bacterial protein of unknown function (DUF916)